MTNSLRMSNEDLLSITQDFNAVYRTPQGKRVLDHIMTVLCKERESPFAIGEPHMTTYKVGRQDIAKEIRIILERDVRSPEKPKVRTNV